MSKKPGESSVKTVEGFLAGKSEHTHELFNHFIAQYNTIGKVTLHPAKTMIAIVVSGRSAAYITQFGKNFIHVVFPFSVPYSDNLCFQKIAQVPGDSKQFNHHFRMLRNEDVNKEVLKFMKMASDAR